MRYSVPDKLLQRPKLQGIPTARDRNYAAHARFRARADDDGKSTKKQKKLGSSKWTIDASLYRWCLVRLKSRSPTLEFHMRQQRTQRMSTPAPISRAGVGLPTSGYALVVDSQAKKKFDNRDRALKSARELKGRFPNLQVKPTSRLSLSSSAASPIGDIAAILRPLCTETNLSGVA
jgi:hypothetical protein